MVSKNVTTNTDKSTNPLAGFHHEMNSFFDRFLKEFIPERGQNHFTPRIEVQDAGLNYLISAELPGMNEQDMDISIENNTLIIQGEKKKENKREGKGFFRSEISYGSFYRAIPLAGDVNPEKISAYYDQGVLKIEVEKNQESTSRGKRITIQQKNKTQQSSAAH